MWKNLENIVLHERSRPKRYILDDSIDRKCPEQINPETGSRLVVARS
jgi:hypothetical protein